MLFNRTDPQAPEEKKLKILIRGTWRQRNEFWWPCTKPASHRRWFRKEGNKHRAGPPLPANVERCCSCALYPRRRFQSRGYPSDDPRRHPLSTCPSLRVRRRPYTARSTKTSRAGSSALHARTDGHQTSARGTSTLSSRARRDTGSRFIKPQLCYGTS